MIIIFAKLILNSQKAALETKNPQYAKQMILKKLRSYFMKKCKKSCWSAKFILFSIQKFLISPQFDIENIISDFIHLDWSQKLFESVSLSVRTRQAFLTNGKVFSHTVFCVWCIFTNCCTFWCFWSASSLTWPYRRQKSTWNTYPSNFY